MTRKQRAMMANESTGKNRSQPEPASELYLQLLKGQITPEEYVRSVNREVREERDQRRAS